MAPSPNTPAAGLAKAGVANLDIGYIDPTQFPFAWIRGMIVFAHPVSLSLFLSNFMVL